MERLPNKVLDNAIKIYTATINAFENFKDNYCSSLDRATVQLLDELKEYRSLEEQGLLLKLPCKVGDTVYAYCSEFGILPYVVDCIVINEHITFQCSSYSNPIGDCPSECLDEIEPDITDFRKTVFLTQEEAEHALKRLESK